MTRTGCECRAADALDCRWLTLLATLSPAKLRVWDANPDRDCDCGCHAVTRPVPESVHPTQEMTL